MIAYVPTLSPDERHAVDRLVAALVGRDRPPLLLAALFGSKARGDFDVDSDVDVLLVFDIDPAVRDAVGATAHRVADHIARVTRIALEPWVVAAADLGPGSRTPMLVDALADGLPLWPPDSPRLTLPFTPADARFCADCLLDWIEVGAPLREWALRRGHLRLAARRARDDITRLATAALLLTGDTRHRRTGSLRRFRQRLVHPGPIPARVCAALDWAVTAYPGTTRGREAPPPTQRAVSTAERGVLEAALMAGEVVPWILERMRTLERMRDWSESK